MNLFLATAPDILQKTIQATTIGVAAAGNPLLVQAWSNYEADLLGVFGRSPERGLRNLLKNK